MAGSPQSIRRWTGGIFLVLALIMLVLGLTLFEGHLEDYAYIIYWMLCFAFTIVAACTALVDMVSIRQSARDEQKELIEETLSKIEDDREQFRGKQGRSEGE